MFANVFLILCAYYFIKPLRDGWLSVSGIPGLTPLELKAYSGPIQGLILIPAVSFYGMLSDRISRSALITGATLFCMSNLVIFFLLRPSGAFGSIPGIGFAFYVWVSMFGVFVVAQFWTFAADVFTDERGRRLMPMVAIGATGGAAFGSSFVGPMVESGKLGADNLMLAALVPLAISIVLTRIVDDREQILPEVSNPDSEAPRESSSRGGFAMFFSSPFLIAAAVITLLLNWVNTNGENLLYSVIVESLQSSLADRGMTDPDQIAEATRDGVTAFYGGFFAWVNAAALVLQAFVASRLLKYGGFGVILLMTPVISMLSYTAMAVVPILAVIKVMKIAENATDYSINNTARQVLWLPATREMKFKGKPAIDTVFVRVGDALAAVTVWFGTHIVILSTQGFFAFNVTLVLLWIGSAIVLIRQHRRLTELNSPGEVA
jgi:AAA family ATP:ADP antiporter